jgi:hypothetical protein
MLSLSKNECLLSALALRQAQDLIELFLSRRVFCRAQAGDRGFRQSAHISDINAAFEATGSGSCRSQSFDNRVIGAQRTRVTIDSDTTHGVGDTGSGRRGVERRREDRLWTAFDSRLARR